MVITVLCIITAVITYRLIVKCHEIQELYDDVEEDGYGSSYELPE